MTYGELKTQFTAILNRTDITTALTETFINQAMSRSQRELRIPAQEKSLETIVTGGFTSIPVPTDYISCVAMICDDKNINYLPLARFLEVDEDGTGQPLYWTRIGNEFKFKPTPTVDQVVDVYYYGEFTPFTDDLLGTTISTVAPDLLIYGALSYAADYYIDERANSFEGRYQSILQALQDQAYDAEGPGPVQPAYSFGDD